MGIFDRFKKSGTSEASAESASDQAPGQSKGGKGSLEFSPEKAKRFFEYARTAQETSRFEYAMINWLSGLRQDPGSMEGLEGFFNAADKFRATGGSGVSKELRNAAGSSTPVDRYLQAICEWSMRPTEAALAVRAMQAPVELGLTDVARWIGPKALQVLVRDERPRKDQALKLMEAFQKVNMFDLALNACGIAVQLDPSDNQLANDYKNLSAMAAMNKGGFDQSGQAGGFRANIRDADRQRQLNESESIVRSDDAAARAIEDARKNLSDKPNDSVAIKNYIQQLLARGTPADEDLAIETALKAHTQTQAFQWRKLAGEIRVRRGRRGLKAVAAKLKATPDDGALRAEFERVEQEQLALEISEYRLQVEAYPTDLLVKYELGKRLMLAKAYEEAVAQLQQAKDDPRHKRSVLHSLGLAFYHMGWTDEAVDTFRQALDNFDDPNGELGLELRYGLMTTLQRKAEETREVAAAEEAYKIASQIAIQNIGYRDIRARRDSIKALITQLKGGAAG